MPILEGSKWREGKPRSRSDEDKMMKSWYKNDHNSMFRKSSKPNFTSLESQAAGDEDEMIKRWWGDEEEIQKRWRRMNRTNLPQKKPFAER